MNDEERDAYYNGTDCDLPLDDRRLFLAAPIARFVAGESVCEANKMVGLECEHKAAYAVRLRPYDNRDPLQKSIPSREDPAGIVNAQVVADGALLCGCCVAKMKIATLDHNIKHGAHCMQVETERLAEKLLEVVRPDDTLAMLQARACHREATKLYTVWTTGEALLDMVVSITGTAVKHKATPAVTETTERITKAENKAVMGDALLDAHAALESLNALPADIASLTSDRKKA